MGKAELTAPWGGRWVEGGEGEAGGSYLERKAEEIYRGRGEVINAQEEWETVRQGLQAEPWRMVSPSSASSAQPRLCCSICLPAAPSERPWGPGGGRGVSEASRNCKCEIAARKNYLPLPERRDISASIHPRSFPLPRNWSPFGSSSAFTALLFSYLHVWGCGVGGGNNTIRGFEKLK